MNKRFSAPSARLLKSTATSRAKVVSQRDSSAPVRAVAKFQRGIPDLGKMKVIRKIGKVSCPSASSRIMSSTAASRSKSERANGPPTWPFLSAKTPKDIDDRRLELVQVPAPMLQFLQEHDSAPMLQLPVETPIFEVTLETGAVQAHCQQRCFNDEMFEFSTENAAFLSNEDFNPRFNRDDDAFEMSSRRVNVAFLHDDCFQSVDGIVSDQFGWVEFLFNIQLSQFWIVYHITCMQSISDRANCPLVIGDELPRADNPINATPFDDETTAEEIEIDFYVKNQPDPNNFNASVRDETLLIRWWAASTYTFQVMNCFFTRINQSSILKMCLKAYTLRAL